MKTLRYIWHKLGSLHLTVILCLALAVDLTYGYISLSRRTILFAPLNDIGLAAWARTYGLHNLAYTAWFFILLILLTLLCVNTFACTTDRVAWLIQRRTHFTSLRFLFRFAPHAMHYALIIILAGYLISYLFTAVDTRTLVQGTSITLHNTQARIFFTGFKPVYFQDHPLPAFQDRVSRPLAQLELGIGPHRKTAILSYNRPIHFQGHGIFLKDFAPKQKIEGMAFPVRIDVSIRKDPGVKFYVFGVSLFTVGLLMYLADWVFFRETKRKAHE